MILSRRRQFLLLSLFLALTLVLPPKFFNLPLWLAAIFLSSVAILVTNLALRDLLSIERLIFSIYPIVLSLGALLAIHAFGLNYSLGLAQIALVLVVLWAFSYLTLLSLNILNVATVRTVPLRKAALSFVYYFGILLSFAGSASFFRLGYVNLGAVALAIFFLAAFLACAFFYFSQVEGITTEALSSEFRPKIKIYWAEGLVLGLITAQIVMACAFLSASVVLKAIFVSGCLFILVSFFQNLVLKRISKKMIHEYLLIWLVLLAALIGSGG